MEIKAYQPTIILIRATPSPSSLVHAALKLTQRKKHSVSAGDPCSRKLLDFVIEANHTSVLEHVFMTFQISDISRSFLAQITRHRMASYTSASQHYADYRDMPFITDELLTKSTIARDALAQSLEAYKVLIDQEGIKPEEARQVLPNAAAVNLLWTINARSLLNFMEQRTCERNTKEMLIFCDEIYEAVKGYWPEYAVHLVPYCASHSGQCNQGKMSCGRPWIKEMK